MKFRPVCAAAALVGTSLLLPSGIRCAQAGEIKIVSPGAYADKEGEGSASGCCPPFRYQQVLPAADFAALGNKPHWLVNIVFRPDQSLTSAQTFLFPDNEYRLATTQREPNNLSLRFDDNLGSDFMLWYHGPVTVMAAAPGPGPGPRQFNNSDRPAGVRAYLFDPSQGNLLMDVIGWQGVSPSLSEDQIPGMQIALYASNPLATQGNRSNANIFQFTFVPVTPGDYNRDRVVNAADYVVWAQRIGNELHPSRLRRVARELRANDRQRHGATLRRAAVDRRARAGNAHSVGNGNNRRLRSPPLEFVVTLRPLKRGWKP